jgi:uncharacterized protein
MSHDFDGYNYLLRLEKGELLVAGLLSFMRKQKITGAWVSGIGGATWAELGFYDLAAQHYRWKKLDQLLEITSLQGNMAWEGDEPFVHLHGSFSDGSMQSFGGHVKELEVAGTCELFIHVWNKDKLTRSQDPKTGLKLLDL